MYPGPNIVTNGLVLALDAANTKSYPGSGTTWRDLSGTSVTGSLVNGPTFNSADLGSIQFDGVDDYVVINDTPELRILSGLTLMSWVNKNTKDIKIVGKWVLPGGGLAANYILRETSGQLEFYISSNGTPPQVGGAVNIAPSTGWNMYSATWDGTTMIGYKNTISGSIKYTSTGEINTPGSRLIIGAEYDTTFPCDANISNLLIYNRALSAQEILQNYNATKSRFGL